jgi:hypothetical protein
MGSVDQYRIGIMNHNEPMVSIAELREFIMEVKTLLGPHGIDFMIKKDTLKYIEEI